MTSTLTSKKPTKRNTGFSVTLTGESPISNQSSGFSVSRTSEKPIGGKYILDKMSDPHYMPTEEEYYAYIKAEDERPKESAITLIKSGIDTAASDLGGMFSGAYDLMLKGEFGEGFKAIGEAAARGTADIGQLARKIVYDNVQYALGDDSSDYEVFLATRKLQSIREKAREGDAGLLFDLTPEANKVAEGLSYITDPSVFVPGAGLVSKATSKVAGGATRLAGKAIGGTGRAGMIAADKVGDIAQRVAPDVSPSDIPRAGLLTSAIQTGRTAPQILDTAGRTLEQASTYIGKQPTRMGVLRSISEDISVPTDIRKFAGMIRFMDTPLAAGGTLGRGAVEGAAIGSVLGGLAEGREGFYSGLGAGGFMGTGAAGLGGAVSKAVGFRRKQAVSREFADYIARKPKEDQENLAKYAGNDHNSMARVMDLERFAIGATGKDMSFRFLDQQQFREELAARESMRLGRKVSPEEVQPARGVQIDDTSPTILINTSHNFNKGRTMAHEIFHGLSKLESMKDFTDRLTDNLFGMYDSAGNLIKDGILLGKGKTKKDRNALTFELGRQYAKLLKSKNDRADFFGADKSTPKEQAEQFRKNLAAEIGAEYFAGLLAGSSPDALLPKNIDSMSRAALDRVMLADAESKLGALRKILNRGFGDIWKWDKATGKPTAGDIFSKDGKPITNSPEINALLRDMVRAKKKVSAKLEYADKSNGNTTAPRNLGQDEIKRLIELNPAMADIFTLTPKGKYVPRDDVAIAADEQRRSDAIVDALDKAPKGTGAGATGGVRVVAEGEYSGMKFNPDQIEALLEIPELNDHVKTHLREINDKVGEGDVLEIDYYAATRKARRINKQTGKPYYISKYSTRIRMSRRKVVPYHMNISKAGNFHVKALDLTQLGNKIDKWGKDKNKKNWIKEWKNTDELYTDLSRYLTNLTKPEGERVPSSSMFGETKRNILNELLGSRRKELVNPLQLLEYAEKDNLIRDFRLDRINQMRWETFMGKEWKMSEDNYQLQKMNYLPLVDPAKLSNVPSVKPSDMLNIPDLKGVFPIQADLTATGKYKGVDSSQLTKSNEVLLMGGPEYPRLMSSAGKNLLWAFKADAKITKAYNRAKETGGYAVIVAMDQFSHSTNPSYVEAALQTIDAYAASGKIDSEGIRLANDDVKDVYIRHKTNEWSNSPAGKKATKEQKEARTLQIKETAKDIPSMSEKRFHDWQFKQSFDFRGELIKKLGSAEYEKHGFPAQKRIADALRSPLHHGVGWGDALYLIKLDMGSGIIKLGEDGYPSHPSYDKGIKGEVVGRFSKPISVEALFDPYLKNLKKQKGSLKGFKRSFELSQPVVKVNQKTLSRIGKVDAYTTIKNQRQANLAVDAINGNWKVSGVKKSEGGISVADFARAIKQNNASPSLPKYSTEQLNKMIKNDEIKLYQLGDGQIYFAIKNRTDGGKELVSVMNNEVAAKGVAGPAILIKAIQEGVTHLDAFAVPSKKHPKGFLYDLYSLFGFKEKERFSFDEKMYLQENRQRYELDDLKHSWRQVDKWDETMGNPDVTFMELNLDANNRQTYGRDFINPSEGEVSRTRGTVPRAGDNKVPQLNRERSADRGAGSRDSGQDSRDAGVVRGSDVGRSDIGTGFNRLIDEITNLSDADLKNLGVDTKKVKQARARIGKPDGPLFMPEVDGKPLGPSSEQMLQSLLDGNISRDQFDAAIEVLRPVDKVEIPTEEKIQLNQDNMRKLSMTMKESQLALIGEAEKLPEGTPVGLRIDIPTFNKSVELMRQGVLNEPVYAVTIHEGADNKSKLGTRIGYDIFSRVKRFSKDKPVRFHTINQTRSEQIGTGEKAKTTLATAEGLLVKSRELPKDLSSWAQVGMNPKRHTYFYDRETGQAVKGGDETINFGNTVFVKNPIYYSNAERLSLFTYMPEALGKSEITKTDDGYKAIKRDGKTRVYSPRGKLIGVASSEKVADTIYRRHNARTVSVR